eukprot:GEMP01025076.1.p1 GENE.GEMP01025076.1~~GEMP01025076.1.p1  ORF type:complete len:663 (+),score=107.40 GEMP01025076.1:30-1991(+)
MKARKLDEYSIEKPVLSTDAEQSDTDSVDSYSSDQSDEEPELNRIGNVPLEWYKDHDHIGYNLGGERIGKMISESEIDNLLQQADNPDAWRTIKDIKNQREVVLTEADVEAIRRIRNHMFPKPMGAAGEEMVEFENPDRIFTTQNQYEPKRRFIPSKWEGMKIKKILRQMRLGLIQKPKKKDDSEVYDLWGGEFHEPRHRTPRPLPAPKMTPPGHAESYNPPPEYLFTEEEKKEWEEMDETERPLSFIPEKFPCLRRVPAYPNLIQERFHRCLDMYLVPRALKKRMNVDKDSLIPRLPSPTDLRPFPMGVSVTYDGHTSRVRQISCDASARWLCTASDDQTCKIWEVKSGRPFHTLRFDVAVHSCAFHPKHSAIILVGLQDGTLFFCDIGDNVPVKNDEAPDFLNLKPRPAEEKTVWEKVEPESALYKQGCRIKIAHDGPLRQVTWHRNGNYVATVVPDAQASSNQCLIHNMITQASMKPFKSLKGGSIQAVSFHPTKALFFVCTQKSVRMYDLQKQQCVKQLMSGARWISSIAVHPGGDHVVIGTYCRRVIWFDLDLGVKPFKTLRYHNRAVRSVGFHTKYPLLATASDDGSLHMIHAKVYSDLTMNPLIVPVKKLTDHTVTDGLGVLCSRWHPTQPWIFSSGADNKVFLWV